jgi:hypothetical protein
VDSGNINAIISAASGLAGVAAGALLGCLKDRRVEQIKDARDISYLATIVVSHLDRFANGCVDVAFDDGTAEGRPAGEDGYHSSTVKPPGFGPLDIKVEWRVLPRRLMYDVLRIPDMQAQINQRIDAVSEFDDPPDYAETFWARRREYAELALFVSSVARRLRAFANLPSEDRDPGDWNRDDEMRKVIAQINEERAAREKRSVKAWAELDPPPVPPVQAA